MEENEVLTENAATDTPEVKDVKNSDGKFNRGDNKFNKDAKGKFNKDGKPQRRENRERREGDGEMKQKLVEVRRVTKVVKGGRKLKFSALVVMGDGKGQVGYGMGRADEVPIAIEKAAAAARKKLITINLVEGSIPHDTEKKYGTSKVFLKKAKAGTGVIAGGSVRAVVELAGIINVVSKVHGSSNKTNCVKATYNALASLRTKEQIAALRGKPVEEI